ncbi:MAG: rRNA pseudouridine synthase [Saprospiraceae bacterium]|nr:rRNA pseudouridine synthase [Saprospiraceae bacterium]
MKKENSKPSKGRSNDRNKKSAPKTDFSSRPKKPREDSDKTESIEGMRLNKYIAYCGVCSRRQAADLVKEGSVTVNGEQMLEPFYQMKPNDVVAVKGKPVKPEARKVYILMNKPKNVITTAKDERGRKTVMDLLAGKVHERVFPVGRLDRDTTGLLLLTNDGELAEKLTHPSHGVKKIYHVQLDRSLPNVDLEKIRKGIQLEDGIAVVDGVDYVEGTKHTELGVEIHIGKNRIVRRIFEHLGYTVERLDRVYLGGLTKKDLPRGFFRKLTDREVIMLKHFSGK